MNSHAETPDCPYRNRFCGLPNGVSKDPRIAAIFSIDITGRMYFSLFPALNRMMVSGTKMISDTSLVTNMDEKNTQQIRKNDSPLMVVKRPAKRMKGRKMFSCLKPSSTVSIMNSVPRVRQSMEEMSERSGGVMKNDITAARTARVSIISFFRKSMIFFTLNHLL